MYRCLTEFRPGVKETHRGIGPNSSAWHEVVERMARIVGQGDWRDAILTDAHCSRRTQTAPPPHAIDSRPLAVLSIAIRTVATFSGLGNQ